MRTTARPLAGIALAFATAGPGAHGAQAGDFSDLEVHPSPASPGTKVTVKTAACGKDGHGVADARSLGAREFKLWPGTDSEITVGRFTVPEDTGPGTYGIEVRCENGKEATGDLEARHREPSGHVRTGVGGSVGPDTTQIAVGAAVLTAAAVGGTLLLRRRASGSQRG